MILETNILILMILILKYSGVSAIYFQMVHSKDIHVYVKRGGNVAKFNTY